MSKTLRIKKGVDIRLAGAPSTECAAAPAPKVVAIQPPDYPGLTPKLAVKAGDAVSVGDALVFDKTFTNVKVASPVAGTVKEVVRGAKRRIMAVVVEAAGEEKHRDFGVWNGGDRDALVAHLAEAGMFAAFRQRPFDVLATLRHPPRDLREWVRFFAHGGVDVCGGGRPNGPPPARH